MQFYQNYVQFYWFKCETTFRETHSPGFSESTGDIGGAGTPLFCLSGCRSMAKRTKSRQFDPPARRARGTTCLLNVPERPCKALLRGFQAAPVRPASCAQWEGAPVVQYGLAARAMCAFLLQLLDYCTIACGRLCPLRIISTNVHSSAQTVASHLCPL